MIDPGNGSKWGIKTSVIDLTQDVHDIIDNSNSYIVVCGYNFSPYSHPSSIIPRLIARRNAGINVLLITPPIMWGFGNRHHTNNIQHLVNNGIGVILNSSNHSKWILSDYGYYYGSLNFTTNSMKKMTEVVSFCNILHQPNIPSWMNQTKRELLAFAVAESSAFNLQTTNLAAANIATLTLLHGILGRILKYNPEIEKVRTTLLNYEDVRLELSSIIDVYFPIVNIHDLDLIWREVHVAIYFLDVLATIGNDLILQDESNQLIEEMISEYNRFHDFFALRIAGLISLFQEERLTEEVQSDLLALTRLAERKLITHL